MRPVLKPGISRVWLDEQTLRLGLGSGRCTSYRLSAPLRGLLDACDGSRDVEGLVGYAERLGVPRDRALSLIDRLALDGALDDVMLATPDLPRTNAAERGRVGPLISALGLRHRLPGGGARALERRAQRQVSVHGLGPTGAQIARQLAASGVGVVRPLDPAPVEHADTAPGTVGAAEVGQRRQDAVSRAITGLNPAVRTVPPNLYRRPDLAILVLEEHPVDLIAELAGAGTPHLPVRFVEDEVVLGPLVVPGGTPCVECADLHRTSADPHWPRLLAQLGAARSGGVPPRDGALCLLAAAYAVTCALSFLDGGEPPVLGAELVLAPPHGLPAHRPLTAHPGCPCGAAPGSFVATDLLE